MTETPLRELRVFLSTSSEHHLCHTFQDKIVVRGLNQRLFAENWIDF